MLLECAALCSRRFIFKSLHSRTPFCCTDEMESLGNIEWKMLMVHILAVKLQSRSNFNPWVSKKSHQYLTPCFKPDTAIEAWFETLLHLNYSPCLSHSSNLEVQIITVHMSKSDIHFSLIVDCWWTISSRSKDKPSHLSELRLRFTTLRLLHVLFLQFGIVGICLCICSWHHLQLYLLDASYRGLHCLVIMALLNSWEIVCRTHLGVISTSRDSTTSPMQI